MHCQQATQLFDAYLDGELSDSLRMELDAHRVRCADCRRALALMEVTGHLVASDRDPVPIHRDFTDRLMACMDEPERHWRLTLRRGLYIGGPLAAAAVIALAFVGVFDNNGPQKVGGVKVTADHVKDQPADRSSELEIDEAIGLDGSPDGGEALDDLHWAQEAEQSLDAKRRSVETLQEHFDQLGTQLIDILEQAEEADTRVGETTTQPLPPKPKDSDARTGQASEADAHVP